MKTFKELKASLSEDSASAGGAMGAGAPASAGSGAGPTTVTAGSLNYDPLLGAKKRKKEPVRRNV